MSTAGSPFDRALAAVASWPVPSAAAAVVGPDGVVAAVGPTEQAFALASVTKPLTAIAALIAVEEEALTLEQPALPEVVPGATLRHLLAHASGLAPERPLKLFGPAVRRVYSNAGFDRIAELVAAATEMPFASYFDEALVGPLRLRRTTLAGSAARAGRSTVSDLAVVISQLIRPRGLLAAENIAHASGVQFPGLRGGLPGFGGQDPNDWGLGFEIRGHKSPHWTGSSNSPRTFGHFGQSGTMFWIDPGSGLGLVALSDRDFGPWAAQAWPALSDAVLAAARS